MSIGIRIVLLPGSLFVGGFVFQLGNSFSYGVESEEVARSATPFWLICSVLVCCPLWLPAVLPSTYQRLVSTVRLVCVFLLLILGGFFSTIVVHNLGKDWAALRAELGFLMAGTVLTSICFGGAAILVRFHSKVLGRGGPP